MTEDDKTSRQIVVSILVAVLVSTLSIVLGFYLGHALQKPRLSIVDLDQNFYREGHKIPEDIRKKLAEQPFLVNALRGQLERAAVGTDQDPCTAWLDGEDWRDSCTDLVLAAPHEVWPAH